MNQLRDLFEAERKRVFEPDTLFTERVMARIDERSQQSKFGLWDLLPGSTRPVLAVALVLLLCFIAVEFFVPQLPQRGIVESFLAPEQTAAERFLYNDADVPSRQLVFEELIAPEDQQ